MTWKIGSNGEDLNPHPLQSHATIRSKIFKHQHVAARGLRGFHSLHCDCIDCRAYNHRIHIGTLLQIRDFSMMCMDSKG